MAGAGAAAYCVENFSSEYSAGEGSPSSEVVAGSGGGGGSAVEDYGSDVVSVILGHSFVKKNQTLRLQKKKERSFERKKSFKIHFTLFYLFTNNNNLFTLFQSSKREKANRK